MADANLQVPRVLSPSQADNHHDFAHSPLSEHQIRFEDSRSPRSRSIQSNEETGEKGHMSPMMKRRQTRANTLNSIRTFATSTAYDNIRPGWLPGEEPGLDPDKPNGGRHQMPELHQDCEITVVDYSEDDMITRHLDNKSLQSWVNRESEKGRESWVKCRWINVNGLSWDVIQCLGKWKKLHRLAIEDMINTRNRTKADWYNDHTYLVLTLQKLVHLHPDGSHKDDEDDSSDDASTHGSRNGMIKAMRKLFGPPEKPIFDTEDGEVHDPSFKYVSAHTDGEPKAPVQKLRTLQRYHGGPNQERMAFMEANSGLTPKNLAVCAEQVSIFLCADNTVISFFQSSADDIELPILSRLGTSDTILRRSCDASMLTQALIDAIIDLAMPVTTAYQDIIGDLELDILTEPDIQQSKRLYIISSEINAMRNFISPITSLVNTLRDHKRSTNTSITSTTSTTAATSITISPMTQTYLGDVEDHLILILNSLDQMTTSSSHLIDLIFNTIGALQNETMKQLTVVTIFFLPMTFITGYFGMNLTDLSLDHGDGYFWSITGPVVVVVMLFLMGQKWWRWTKKMVLRRGIKRSKEGRMKRERAAWKRRKGI